MSNTELTAKVKELRDIQALIAEAEAEAEAIRDSIKRHMGAREECRAGEYHVIWKVVKSARIDTTALKKALPDVAQAFTKESTVRRFVIA